MGFLMIRRSTKYIVIHCAATRANMDVGAKEINQWHKARGWSGIGYHYVIRRNGAVEKGRAENAVGAHVENHNSNSIGVCLVGGLGEGKGWPPENNFTDAQWASLNRLVGSLIDKYPGATILGHRDFPGVSKACPSFDARAWAKSVNLPASPNLKGMKEGAKFGIGSMVSGGIGEGVEKTGGILNDNAETVGQFVNGANEKLTEAAVYFTWAGYALKLLALAVFLYSAFCFARIAWRWWKGEGDYGAHEEPIENDLDVIAPPTARRKRRL